MMGYKPCRRMGRCQGAQIPYLKTRPEDSPCYIQDSSSLRVQTHLLFVRSRVCKVIPIKTRMYSQQLESRGTAANFQRTTHVIIYKYRKKQFAVRHRRSCVLISSIGPRFGQGLLKVPKLHLRRWSNKLRATCMLLCCLEHRRRFGRRRFLYEPLTTTRNHLLSRLQTMDLCAMLNHVHLYIYPA